MALYQTKPQKPTVIKAEQWDGSDESYLRILELRPQPDVAASWCMREGNVLQFPTPISNIWAVEGDWIIFGPDGKLEIIKPDIFEQMYELVKES